MAEEVPQAPPDEEKHMREEIYQAIIRMTGKEYRDYLEMCHKFGGYREDIECIPEGTAEHEKLKEEFIQTHKFKNWWGAAP